MASASIAIFRLARDEFAEHPEVAPSPALLARLIDQYSAPTAARIAASWELSERIVDALAEQELAAGASAPRRAALGQALYFGRVDRRARPADRRRRASRPKRRAPCCPTAATHALQVDRIWERMMRASKRHPRCHCADARPADQRGVARRRPVSAVDRPPRSTYASKPRSIRMNAAAELRRPVSQ